MAYKHQMNSYRTRNGQRFECWEDVGDRSTAMQSVANLCALGKQAFFEKGDGYYRVFVAWWRMPGDIRSS